MAVFHSHLVECSACCCFCVYVLCSQLITMRTEEPTRQLVTVYTFRNSLYKCMTSMDLVQIGSCLLQALVGHYCGKPLRGNKKQNKQTKRRRLSPWMYFIHLRHITTWLRLEICTTCNAWDKYMYKSCVLRVMLGTNVSLAYQVLCLGQV